MKTLETRPEILVASATAAAHPTGALATLLARFSVIRRALRNRRDVLRLEDLTDQQLADIGIDRRDVSRSLALPWHEDPSRRLSQAAWRNRAAHRDPA